MAKTRTMPRPELRYRATAPGREALLIISKKQGLGDVMADCMRQVAKAWQLQMSDELPEGFKLVLVDDIPDPPSGTIH